MLRPDIVYICVVMAFVSLLELLFLLAFIFSKEAPRKKGVLTTFNACLCFLLLSQVGNFLVEIIIYVPATGEFAYIRTVANIFSSTYEYCYLGYSFARGFGLVVEVFPKIAPILLVLFQISPVILYLPVLSSFFATNWPQYKIISSIGQYVSFASAMLVLSVESIVLVSFVRYLGRVMYGITAVDRKFVIVASYGIACIVLGFAAVVFYALFIRFNNDMWFVGVLVNFTFISGIMIAMKLALHEEEVNKKKHISSLGRSMSNIRKTANTSLNGANCL